MPITRLQFEEGLHTFNDTILNSLQLVPTASNFTELQVLNNYCKSQPRPYSLTCLNLLGPDPVKVTFTVCYDEFYRVPVCDFRAVRHDGKREVVMTSLSAIGCFSQMVKLDSHPIFDTPWFSVHPCETLQTLEEFAPGSGASEYLQCWFGLYGLPSVLPMLQSRPVNANDRDVTGTTLRYS